jgi:superoxide reductase
MTPIQEELMPEDTIHSDRRSFLKKSLAIAVTTAMANSGIKSAFAQSSNKELDLFNRINRAEDPTKLKGLELGHVPQIMAPNTIHSGRPFEVEIRVGEKLHEMIPSHYIDWVDLYADEIFLAKIILTPNFTNPVCKVVLSLNSSTTLRAIEHCNLHGLWESSKKITVQD